MKQIHNMDSEPQSPITRDFLELPLKLKNREWKHKRRNYVAVYPEFCPLMVQKQETLFLSPPKHAEIHNFPWFVDLASVLSPHPSIPSFPDSTMEYRGLVVSLPHDYPTHLPAKNKRSYPLSPSAFEMEHPTHTHTLAFSREHGYLLLCRMVWVCH